jgi:two-component system alkaline phosphatase synthesis response regulator PhoP
MSISRKKLLLVDDDEDWLALLKRFLEAQGYGVMVARDRISAVKAAAQVCPDCAIVDLRLDNDDGLNVCKDIKTISVLKKTPVIMMSGLDGVREDSGCDAFFCKADGMERLLTVLKTVLSKN